MIIKKAVKEDTQEILTLQKLAYQSEAAIYNDYTIPPLVETKKQIEAALQKQVYLKVIIVGRIIRGHKYRTGGETLVKKPPFFGNAMNWSSNFFHISCFKPLLSFCH